jgi:ABC-type dipeptide/oligopeptide/nickel transport system permease component
VVIYFRTGLRPLPIAGYGVDEHLVLPALALGLRPAAYIFRLTAIAVEEIRHRDYVRTGVAKGLLDRQLLIRHVLPNAWPAIVAATVLGARAALSSLLIVEFVYIWGGAGTLFVQTLAQRRLEVALQIAIAFAIGSLLLDAIATAARSRTPTPA